MINLILGYITLVVVFFLVWPMLKASLAKDMTDEELQAMNKMIHNVINDPLNLGRTKK
jgi:hypothetical protein